MASAKKIFASFDEQQKEFANKKTISSTLKIEAWQSFLSKIALYDKKLDKNRSTWRGVGIGAAFLGFFLFFFSMALEPLLLLATGFVVWVCIYSFTQAKKLTSKDISNFMREFFLPVLHVLGQKAGLQAKLSATLDFRIPQNVLTPETSKVRHKIHHIITRQAPWLRVPSRQIGTVGYYGYFTSQHSPTH